ncbi:DUF4236 domain-containing protein [Vibrio neptunius]
MPYTAFYTIARSPRLPVPNRHVTGQGHYRIPQKS